MAGNLFIFYQKQGDNTPSKGSDWLYVEYGTHDLKEISMKFRMTWPQRSFPSFNKQRIRSQRNRWNCFLVTEFVSNMSTLNIFGSIIVTAAHEMGYNQVQLLLAVSFAASFAFMLPMAGDWTRP